MTDTQETDVQKTIDTLAEISARWLPKASLPYVSASESAGVLNTSQFVQDADVVLDHLPLLLRCLRACRKHRDDWDCDSRGTYRPFKCQHWACAALRSDHSGCETNPCGTCR